MRLTRLRVQNYKIVEDSGEFTVAPITCMVGKNESGKSALLEALYKLNPDVSTNKDFNDIEEYPRRNLAEYQAAVKSKNSSPANVLTSSWELDDDDVLAVESVLGPSAVKSRSVTITKGYDNVSRFTFSFDEPQVVEFLLSKGNLPSKELEDLRSAKSVQEMMQKLRAVADPSSQQTQLLADLTSLLPDDRIGKAAIGIISPRMPKFIFFSSYHVLPGEVSLNELASREASDQLTFQDRVFLALLELAGTTPNELQALAKFEEFVAKLEGVSNYISAQIFEYWTQNKNLEVQFHLDDAKPEDAPPFNTGQVFRTRIRNTRHKVTVSFDARSSGFVWFFSFLVWFSQVKQNYGTNLFILLDEPGLTLHARAQSDLLRYMHEKLKPIHQVMYTTHSPFMIDSADILNVRTVEDLVEGEAYLGTRVGDKVFSTDVDTVFPLQAALGYDITQSLFVGKNTLLVEGPSDLLYLKWFSRELAKLGRTALDPRWVIAPVGGIDKVASFMALFGGNALNVAVLTDFQDGEKKKVRDLRESKLLKQGQVFSAEMYVSQAEADIEDLVGRSMYRRLIAGTFGLDAKTALPAKKPEGAPVRLVKEVEEHFRTLPPTIREFDHYSPAAFLVETASKNMPGLTDALARFEAMFRDLNVLLS